jgi:hypothetical protein
MNPPTPGHLLLIKSMIYKAIEVDAPNIYVLLSKTVDEKNPLPCDFETIPITDTGSMQNLTYKSNILNNMLTSYKQELINIEPDLTKKNKINNLDINVLCTTSNPFGFISKIINDDFIQNGISTVNLYVVVGSDRADFLESIKNYFKTKPYISSVNGNILNREQNGDASSNLAAMSATHVRGLVKKNDFTAFQNVYSNYLDQNQIKNLYDSIGLGLQINQPIETVKKGKRATNDVQIENVSRISTSSRITRSSRHGGGRKRRITRKNKRNKRNKRKTNRRY